MAWNKSAIRKDVSLRLKEFLGSKSHAAIEALGESMARGLQRIVNSTRGVWALFWPFADEPSFLGFMTGEYVFPKIQGSTLVFLKADPKNNAQWESGPLGTKQPKVELCQQLAFSDLAGVVVPGRAFDVYGNRLGRGRGFYDQALSSFKGLKVGIAYDVQVYEQALPVEPHDICVNKLITQSGTFSLTEAKNIMILERTN